MKTISRHAPSTQFQKLKKSIKWVDLVIEVVDARLPISSRHPNSHKIFGQKPGIIVFSKSDLADTNRSKNILKTSRLPSKSQIFLSLKEPSGKRKLTEMVLKLAKVKSEAKTLRGVLQRPSRVMVVGMPNVGKSTLINWLIGRKLTKTGNRPGITRGQQWARINPQLELLDTPGILPAAMLIKETALKLALLNLLTEHTYNIEEIAMIGLTLLKDAYPELLSQYLKSSDLDFLCLEDIARKKNLLTTGGKPDSVRAANILVSDIRNGRVGKITLDSLT